MIDQIQRTDGLVAPKIIDDTTSEHRRGEETMQKPKGGNPIDNATNNQSEDVEAKDLQDRYDNQYAFQAVESSLDE